MDDRNNPKKTGKQEPSPHSPEIVTYKDRGHQTTVRKSNELVQLAMYNLSLSQQKLMLHIFAMIQPTDMELPEYELSIYEFTKICGITQHGGSIYQAVKKNIEDIANMNVQWISNPGTAEIETFRWIYKTKINQETGKMRIILDPALKPHLIQLKSLYTTLNISYTMPMKSQYSVRIYELCKSYQNLYLQKKAAGEPLVWELDTLRQQVACNYQLWTDLKRYVLEKAKSEINQYTDIRFDYAEHRRQGKRVVSIAVTIERLPQEEARERLNQIENVGGKSISPRKKKAFEAQLKADTGFGDDVMSLGYVSAPSTTIPYSYGADKAALVEELRVKAQMEKLTAQLTAAELNAVETVIDIIASSAGQAKANEKMIDGGNAKYFGIMNEVILRCGSMYQWFLGIAPRYAETILPLSRKKSSPVAYLAKIVREDLENFRVYTQPGEGESAPAGELYEVPESAVREVEPPLHPRDAQSLVTMKAALLRNLNREKVMARLTSGQQLSYYDILEAMVRLCRRNKKGVDDGSVVGKANMQFLDALNGFIAQYGSLDELLVAMSVKLDYDTYWEALTKDPEVKNPKAVFKHDVEQCVLMPAATVKEYEAGRKKNTGDAFTVDWNTVFDED